MTTSQKPAPGHRNRPDDAPWRNPVLHLSACLAIAALVTLAILAIHWLT
jgi:hypothetical protein